MYFLFISVLGFPHAHCIYNRDDYVRYIEDNLLKKKEIHLLREILRNFPSNDIPVLGWATTIIASCTIQKMHFQKIPNYTH